MTETHQDKNHFVPQEANFYKIYNSSSEYIFFFFKFFFLISSPLQNLIRFTTTQHYCFPVTHDPTMSMTSNCWHTTKSCKIYKSAARETPHSRVPRTL